MYTFVCIERKKMGIVLVVAVAVVAVEINV